MPATAGGASSMASVGTRGVGKPGRKKSRFNRIEPRRSQQMMPIPNDASPMACKWTCAAQNAPIRPPATVGRK